jgi:hypothetical protein
MECSQYFCTRQPVCQKCAAAKRESPLFPAANKARASQPTRNKTLISIQSTNSSRLRSQSHSNMKIEPRRALVSKQKSENKHRNIILF